MTTTTTTSIASTAIIPDIALRQTSNEYHFACSSNILYVYIDKDGTKISFSEKGIVPSDATLRSLENLLFNKGFINLGSRILFNLKKAQKVIEEDFVYYLIMTNGSRIKISKVEADSLKSYLIEF